MTIFSRITNEILFNRRTKKEERWNKISSNYIFLDSFYIRKRDQSGKELSNYRNSISMFDCPRLDRVKFTILARLRNGMEKFCCSSLEKREREREDHLLCVTGGQLN